ncbi:hypothetical protein [Krasilnikovia sp. M28-CT-15]|uniref:hypothetical protein n=1 Tax=Krasilnikovia sp. M28-CT-15 TaxID=3373540 RepID=UPI00399D50EA
MALAGLGVANVALANMSAMQDRSDYMFSQTLVPITQLAKMRYAAQLMRGNLLNARCPPIPPRCASSCRTARPRTRPSTRPSPRTRART